MQSELKYLPSRISLLPSVDQRKHAVISPNSVPDFLEYLYSFGRCFTEFESPDSIDKETVLRGAPICLKFGLID